MKKRTVNGITYMLVHDEGTPTLCSKCVAYSRGLVDFEDIMKEKLCDILGDSCGGFEHHWEIAKEETLDE